MDLTEAAKEAIYLQGFLSELNLSEPTRNQIMNDNRGAQFLATNHMFHARSKHIDLRHHFIREILHDGKLEIKYLPSEKMPADFLTKGLTKDKRFRCLGQVGIEQDQFGAALEGEC